MSYVGRGQKWDRAINLYGEGQGIQRGEIAREGSVWCSVRLGSWTWLFGGLWGGETLLALPTTDMTDPLFPGHARHFSSNDFQFSMANITEIFSTSCTPSL